MGANLSIRIFQLLNINSADNKCLLTETGTQFQEDIMDIDPKHVTKANTDIHGSHQIWYLAQLHTTTANYFGFFNQKVTSNNNTQPVILQLLEEAWLVLASPEAHAFIDAYNSLLPWLAHSLQHKLHNVL